MSEENKVDEIMKEVGEFAKEFVQLPKADRTTLIAFGNAFRMRNEIENKEEKK